MLLAVPTPPPPDFLPVFNVLPGAHLLLSPTLHILAVSDEYLTASLTQRSTLVGQYLFDALPDNPQVPEAQSLSNLRASLRQVLTTGQPHMMPLQPYDIPDSKNPGQFVERHWLPRNTPVLDASGQVQAILHTVTDFTATRLAQHQLRESQVREHVAYLEVKDALQATQRQREQVQYHNEELAVLNEELNVLNQELLTSNTALSEAQQQLQQLNQELEARVRARTQEAQTAAQRQAQARQAAEASARQLRLVTDALPVLIGYLDRDQKYQFANRAYEPWFHLRADEILGRPIREIAGEQAYANIQPYIARALAGERVEFEVRMPFREDFIKHIHTTYIPDVQHRQVVGFYTLVADVTDQVEARQAVEASAQQAQALARELGTVNEQLRRINADLDNFVYTASHDLKAPISNIEGLLHLLQGDLPAEVAQDASVEPTLRLMGESVERFKRTIEHLTEVTKLQKEHDPGTTAVALAGVVEEVRQDLAPLILESGACVRVEVTDFPLVQFSEKNLRSIVYNLLSNALKYRSPDRTPHIDVRAHVWTTYTVLAVHDNGLGIAESQLPKLFTMFQRFHDHVEGTGIGLYMVKKIVENAGGKLEVHSQLGAGTTFFVHLPHPSA